MKNSRGQKLVLPLNNKIISSLKNGDRVLVSGTLYTARDQAHKKLVELIIKGKKLPFDLNNQIIFYAGPTPGKNGKIVGSIGPTTASRMDSFVEPLLKNGLKGMIGKGPRDQNIKKLLKQYKAVYFIATGGVAALLGKCIKNSELIAFPELGPEAVLKLEVKDFPLIVAYDAKGNDFFEEEREE
ncbi:fumarate hydratase [candidate division WOR-1 bacterium RIFOXYA2_FULL_36_21]|uniref:Fumarate hydratase n=1 Tax=candidate division WOR-1 bacterium RIFOXYB2_FULL_36_35 TaxID=1802578 RepID=A0A1F4S2T3_UNCSA|nr:MAG: fumarate hydratase [candidate division WOR-1 bacterium RIFOXYA2_FULL_36_21]OGC14754.1 MAG: fumarate hydratase [candidate division WOR-1 bacterium RIFOXYB2_FULL_36_35]OGC15462.1 MAG: fumarate hydratase [candidate division WOR-1 bacterium RIFOXYA12_FULL_36_13]